MKLRVKLLAFVAAVGCSTSAVADTFVFDSEAIFGTGGDKGGSLINVFDNCNETPSGISGLTVIFGDIDGVFINEVMFYPDSCPDINNNGNQKNPSNTVTLNGIVVTSDCTNQATQVGSGNTHVKFPGEKPQLFSDQFSAHFTDNTFSGSCVITATNASGGTETYGVQAQSNGIHRRSHRVNN